MTEKGKKSEFSIVIGEKAETTHSLYIIPTPIEYWLLTGTLVPAVVVIDTRRDKQARIFRRMARRFPNGLSEAPELPEKRSGEVSRLGAVGARVPSKPEPTHRTATAAAPEDALEEELV